MVIRSSNPWEVSDKAGLVSIGTHHLYLSTSGKARSHGSPVVLFFTGGGAPVAYHVRLQKLVSDFARIYLYDRSGYDASERGPDPSPTAVVAAKELDALLKAVRVEPPYILVGHSYGGIVAREFLHLCRTAGMEVAGMVLADTATELTYQLYARIPSEDLVAISADINFAELTHLKEESGLSDEEWKTAVDAVQHSAAAANAEDNRTSARILARKRQFQNQALGKRPLSVIRCNSTHDYQILYAAAVETGNGTAEQRESARKFIKTWNLFNDELAAAQLRLSSRSRYRYVEDSGHDIPIRRPEIVAEEIRWALEQALG